MKEKPFHAAKNDRTCGPMTGGPGSDGRGKSVAKADRRLHTKLMARLPVGRSGVTLRS
jgi:hypothetical protein